MRNEITLEVNYQKHIMNLQTKGLIMKLHRPLYFKNKILNLKMCGGIFFFFKLAGNVHALAHPKGLVAFLPLEIIEGAGYTKGKPYCWSYKTEGVRSFNGSDNNPNDYNEMIAFVKKELDGKPECIWIKPYDRNNKPKVFSLTDDIETKRRFLINDFEKQGFKDCEGVKWVI